MLLNRHDYKGMTIIPKSDKYGIAAMRVGDCIVIKNRNSTQMSGVVCYFRKLYNRNYVLRKIDTTSCKIWRLE